MPFEYNSSLCSKDGAWIRLLTLQPYTRLDEIPEDEELRVDVTLQDYKFDDSCPPYEALSYAWGVNPRPKRIRCNGEWFITGDTLYKALLYLRDPKEARVFWIDLFCINQKDDEEKGQQVGMMREIFARSKHTIAWLGGMQYEIELHVVEALNVLKRLALGALDELLLRDDTKKSSSNSWFNPSSPLGKGVTPDLSISRMQTKSVELLLRKRWFKRVWILQEAALPRTVVAQCGFATLDVDVLLLGAMIYVRQQLVNNKMNLLPNSDAAHLLTELRYSNPDAKLLDLPDLLAASRQAGSSEKRDNFYALYGLTTTDLSALGLRADYSAPVERALVDATHALLKAQGNLNLLELAEGQPRGGAVDIGELPSWVPAALGPAQYSPQFLNHNRRSQNLLCRAAARSLYHDLPKKWTTDPATLPEKVFEDIAKLFTDLSTESKMSTALMPYLPVIEELSFNVDKADALVVQGQIIDKIEERSRSPTWSQRANEADDEDNMLVDKSIDSLHDFLRALLDRDEMVERRLEKHKYPTGESVLTAYRKTVCTGHELTNEKEAARGFNGVRQTIGALKMADWVRGDRIDEDSFPGMLFGVGAFALGGWAGKISSMNANMSVWMLMRNSLNGRRLIWTEKGYLALVPEESKVGDSIVLVQGARLPFIMRPKESGWRLLGPSYVHGVVHDKSSSMDIAVEDIRVI